MNLFNYNFVDTKRNKKFSNIFSNHVNWRNILYLHSSKFTSALIKNCVHHNAPGARGVVVIVVGNEHGDKSSNPGPDWLHFT